MNLLFKLLILLLPLGVIFRFKLFQNVYVYPIDCVVGLIFLLTMYRFLVKKEKIVNYDIFKTLVIFLSVGFISLVINSQYLNTSQFLTSFAYSLRFASYMGIFFATQFLTKKEISKMPTYLTVGGLIFVLVGFLQFIYYKDLRNLYYLGWDQHLYRLFSTFLDPNFAGAFLVLVFLLIFGKMLSKFITKNMRSLFLFSLLGVLTLVAIILTYSRSAVIMLIVGISIMLFINNMIKQLVISIVVIISLVLLFANFKIEGLNPFRIMSSEARLRSMNEATHIISENPLIGVGFNSYRYAQVKQGARSDVGISQSNADSGTDNSFLFVFATSGIVGFIVFVKLLFQIGSKILKQIPKNKKDILPVIVFSSFISILVDSLFINSFFYIFILAWILIILGISLHRKSTSD